MFMYSVLREIKKILWRLKKESKLTKIFFGEVL